MTRSATYEPEIWYRAVRCSSAFEQTQLASSLRQKLRTPSKDLRVLTINMPKKHIVVVFSLAGEPATDRAAFIKRTLDHALSWQLPAALLHQIMQDQRASFSITEYVWKEEEATIPAPAPVPTRSSTPADQAADSSLAMEDRHILPLMERYKQRLHETLVRKLDAVPAEATAAMSRTFQAEVDLARIFFFSRSAYAMHQAVYEYNPTWIMPQDTYWIALEEPLPLKPGRVHALYVHQLYPHKGMASLVQDDPAAALALMGVLDEHNGIWAVEMLFETGLQLVVCLYDSRSKEWIFPAEYPCSWNDCFYIEDRQTGKTTRVPCERCVTECLLWASWLHTAIRILHREFATTPQAPVFPEHQLTTTTHEQVPRARGKGPAKTKTVRHHRSLTLVTFEVSERAEREKLPERQATEAGEAGAAHRRTNWLKLTDETDLIYEQYRFQGIEREYHAPWYRPLIERCRAASAHGDTLRSEDGMEYTLIQSADGDTYVRGSIKPYTRYIPYLKPEKRKQRTAKKVVARRYTSQQVTTSLSDQPDSFEQIYHRPMRSPTDVSEETS